MSHAMLNVHALSGCDATSSFVRHVKLTVKSKLENKQKIVSIFTSLGSSIPIRDVIDRPR